MSYQPGYQSSYPSYNSSDPLQFYSGGPSTSQPGNFYGSTPGPIGNVQHEDVSGNIGGAGLGQLQGGFWAAFTPAGYENEPPLMQELGINFGHIKTKSMAVLNPLKTPDQNIMDDADLAGPIIFAFCFGMFLLFSGKPQFGYIYGVALLGVVSIYSLLNLMNPSGIDAYRVASVLGYCLLPLVIFSFASVIVSLDSSLGYVLSILSITWCSYSASGIFVSVLQMSNQRYLVAYPVMLFYASFALLSVFAHKVLE